MLSGFTFAGLVSAYAFIQSIGVAAENVLAGTPPRDLVRDERATRFHDVLLLLGYWIPAFVAVVVIDCLLCVRGRATIHPRGS